MHSPLWALAPALAALAAGVVRWLIQGSGNLYTAVAKRFYVPDPDLGWRVAGHRPVWLGVEVLAAMAALVAAVAAGALLVRWRERRRERPWLGARAALWLVAAVPLAVPVWAFASGGRPGGGRDALPMGATAAAPERGFEGGLDLPAGTYQVVAHAGTSVTAAVEAGEEAFDARFARGITGTWTGDPAHLDRPMTVTIAIDASVVDTGIGLRSQHAREEYLHVDRFPKITLDDLRMSAARRDGPGLVAFRATARLGLMGEAVPVEVTGVLRAPDGAARARLGLTDDDAVVLVQADLAITVSGTPLRGDRDSFDADRIPIHVSLVLTRSRT